jgi:hypothetical protein
MPARTATPQARERALRHGGRRRHTRPARRWHVENDPADWQAFLRVWQALHTRPATARELCESADTNPDQWGGTFPHTSRGDLPTPKSLGRILTERHHRPTAGDLVVRSVIDANTKIRLYWVDPADQPPPINRLAGATSIWW